MAKITDRTSYPLSNPSMGGYVLGVDENDTSDSPQGSTKAFFLDRLGKTFDTRADFVTAVGLGFAQRNGNTVYADGIAYKAQSGATAISDLPGWASVGPTTPQHFGALADGSNDDTGTIQAAFARGGDIYLPSGIYRVTKSSLEALSDYGLVPANGSTVTFGADAWIQLEEGVDVRHIIASIGGSDITIRDPKIDGNGSACNGIGFAAANNVTITGDIHVKNIRSAANGAIDGITTFGGGRGITFQSDCDNINIGVVRAFNCFQAVDVTGKPGNAGNSVVCQGIIAEQCDLVFGAVGTQNEAESGGFDNTGVIVGFISFYNCGASTQDDRLNASFIREDSTGNNWPWQGVDRSGTTFSGDDYTWAIGPYNAGDDEWDADESYAVSDRVKFTNNGEYSSIITVSHAGGVTIGDIRGRNDSDYTASGFIGALFWGMGQNVRIGSVDIDCDVRHAVRIGANPNLGVVTRPTEMAQNICVEAFRNVGVTEVIVDTDGPYVGSVRYASPALSLRGFQVMETGNIALAGNNILTEPGSIGSRLHEEYLEVYNLEKGGWLRGYIGQVGQYALTDVNALSPALFKDIHAGPLKVSSYQSADILAIERTGSNAGLFSLQVLGNDLIVRGSTGNALARFETDTGDFRVLTAGSGLWLKQPNGTERKLTIDNSGRLLIGGAVVGTQS